MRSKRERTTTNVENSEKMLFFHVGNCAFRRLSPDFDKTENGTIFQFVRRA